MRASDVFVPGGFPQVTYVARDALGLETRVSDYLDERHKVLSLSGPTKSGKTVLVRKVVPDAVWISGGDASSAGAFWSVLVDRLDGWLEVTKTRAKTETDSTGSKATLEGSAVVVKGGGELSTEVGNLDERVHSVSRSRAPQQVALDLLRAMNPVLVVDDFHYLSEKDQLLIIRGLRGVVFDGVAVILLSVPHRVYDAIRAEPEMTGRVVPLQIPFWGDDELSSIAKLGFGELGVSVSRQDLERMVEQSFGSPHLMQEFCLELCKANEVRETVAAHRVLKLSDWEGFFRERADATAKVPFERLARGPRVRTKRIPRTLKDGRVVDIYGLVLAAIASTGPRVRLTAEEVRDEVRKIVVGDPPALHEVTRVLDQMTEIARGMKGEPVVDYMGPERELHIADPFFAYYLRWGDHKK